MHAGQEKSREDKKGMTAHVRTPPGPHRLDTRGKTRTEEQGKAEAWPAGSPEGRKPANAAQRTRQGLGSTSTWKRIKRTEMWVPERGAARGSGQEGTWPVHDLL